MGILQISRVIQILTHIYFKSKQNSSAQRIAEHFEIRGMSLLRV